MLYTSINYINCFVVKVEGIPGFKKTIENKI